MVYFHSSISLSNSSSSSSVDLPPLPLPPPTMASSASDSGSKSKNRKTSSSSNSLQIPPCHRSRSAVVDVVILVAVIAAFAILMLPCFRFLITESVKYGCAIMFLVKEEVSVTPWIYVSIGVSFFCAALATWSFVSCTTRKCGNPNCQGLRNATEFDIQLETEDSVKNSPSLVKYGGVKKGLFKLPCQHHRELEAELKKMAPPNGRAVLILRATCGCSVGRLEVPGPKKNRKIKK